MAEQSPESKRYRAAAVACLKNTFSLQQDARILFEQDRLPRALALSIIADEELAKTVLFTIAMSAGTGVLPGLDRLSLFHRAKQSLAEFVAPIARLTRPAFQEVARLTREAREAGLDPKDHATRDRILMQAAERMNEEASRFAEEGRPPSLGIDDPQTTKNRCLYADPGIDAPATTPEEACPPRAKVEAYLAGLDARVEFVCWLIAGNVKDGRVSLDDADKSIITEAWNAMRRHIDR